MHGSYVPDLVCAYLWTAWWITWLGMAFFSKKTKERESAASRISYMLIAWLAMYLMFFGEHLSVYLMGDVFPRRTWVAWTGVAITALGFAITYWARFTLGRNWSGTVTIKENHELIRTGPYRIVRHPIYTGVIVALAGTALTRDEYRGILAVLLLWVSFTIKRRKEEQFMRQVFGTQYDDYARTTGAIFPALLRRGS